MLLVVKNSAKFDFFSEELIKLLESIRKGKCFQKEEGVGGGLKTRRLCLVDRWAHFTGFQWEGSHSVLLLGDLSGKHINFSANL